MSFIKRFLGPDMVWVLLIAAAGIVLRSAAIWVLNHPPQSDELAYLSMATNFLKGKGIVDSLGYHAMYNVGYPFFVLTPTFWLVGESLNAVRVVHAFLGGVSILLCYGLAREAGAGRVGRLLAAGFWALYLPSSVYAVYIAKENLMTPLILMLCICTLRMLKEPTRGLAFAVGALCGTLALVGNSALSLGGMVAVALALHPDPWRKRLAFVAIVGVTAVAICSPWIIRNYLVLGVPLLNTNGGFNLYLGNNALADGWFVSISETPRGPTWDALRAQGELHLSQVLKSEAIEWIRSNPVDFSLLALKKGFFFWSPPIHHGKGEVSTAEMLVRWAWLGQYVLLALLAVVGWLYRELRNRRLLLLWVGLLGYTSAHMLFYVIFRYREPVMPILAVMAAMVVERMVRSGVVPSMPRAVAS